MDVINRTDASHTSSRGMVYVAPFYDFVGQNSKGIQIRAQTILLNRKDFRGHVSDSPSLAAHLVLVIVRGTLRHELTQAKVSKAQISRVIDQDIGRLQVTMYYGRFMAVKIPHS